MEEQGCRERIFHFTRCTLNTGMTKFHSLLVSVKFLSRIFMTNIDQPSRQVLSDSEHQIRFDMAKYAKNK